MQTAAVQVSRYRRSNTQIDRFGRFPSNRHDLQQQTKRLTCACMFSKQPSFQTAWSSSRHKHTNPDALFFDPQLRLVNNCDWKIIRYKLIYTRGGNKSRWSVFNINIRGWKLKIYWNWPCRIRRVFKTGFNTGSTSRYTHSIKYLKDFKFRQEHTVCAWTVFCGFFVILSVVYAHTVCKTCYTS